MKPGGVKLEFELDVDRAQLGVQDMQDSLESGDVDAFLAAGWASMAAIERSMQAVLAIKLGQLRAQDED